MNNQTSSSLAAQDAVLATADNPMPASADTPNAPEDTSALRSALIVPIQESDLPAAGPVFSSDTDEQSPKALLTWLRTHIPVFTKSLPLALRIDKALLARYPELPRKLVLSTLRLHVYTTAYLRNVKAGHPRFDLLGQIAQEMDEAHREYAKELLHQREQKHEEERKKKREALRELKEKAKKEAQETQRKQEKLSQLVERFGK